MILRQVITDARAALEALFDGDLAEFNNLLRSRGLNPLISDGEGG